MCEVAIPTLGLILEESVDFGHSSVESNDSETVIGSVQNEILAHDRKANETEITTRFGLRIWSDLEAGQSRTKVSILVIIGDLQKESVRSKKRRESISDHEDAEAAGVGQLTLVQTCCRWEVCREDLIDW
jgi:hypothetical protein